MAELPVINALWIGPRLGPIHAACLRSFVREGHRTILHCYAAPEDTPGHVELSDASRLLPESRVVHYRKSGSYSLFSNFLRYEILREGLGLYVDCDVYCLEPIPDSDYIVGWQTNESINGAVLKLPPECPALKDLCKLKDARHFIPPWQSAKRKREWRVRRALGLGRPVDELPWGTTGPDAVTWYLRQHGLDKFAQPSDVFYPVAHYHTGRLFDPGLTIQDLVTKRTKAIHLYHETFRGYALSTESIPPSSPVGRMISAAG